jgi:hypothetical protein
LEQLEDASFISFILKNHIDNGSLKIEFSGANKYSPVKQKQITMGEMPYRNRQK